MHRIYDLSHLKLPSALPHTELKIEKLGITEKPPHTSKENFLTPSLVSVVNKNVRRGGGWGGVQARPQQIPRTIIAIDTIPSYKFTDRSFSSRNNDRLCLTSGPPLSGRCTNTS